MTYEDKLFEIFYESQAYQNLILEGLDDSSHQAAEYREKRRKHFDEWRANPDAIWIVIDRDGDPVAYAATDYNPAFNQLGVGDISVRADLRSQGIGKELMGRITEKAKEMDAGSVFLAVHKDNIAARRLYEQLGFAYRENKYLDMELTL